MIWKNPYDYRKSYYIGEGWGLIDRTVYVRFEPYRKSLTVSESVFNVIRGGAEL